jgi:cytochrome c oxidase assembly factor CtaG
MDTLVSHWSASWLVGVIYLAAVVTHVTGLRRMLAAPSAAGGRGLPQASRRELVREAAAFHGGLLCALAALVSPIAYWSAIYIWVRGIQDLTLCFVAPSLIVLGAPWLALRAGLPWPHRDGAGRPASDSVVVGRVAGDSVIDGSVVGGSGATGNNASSAGPVRIRWWLAWPVGVTIAFNVIWLGWHLPLLFDLALRNTTVRYAEYVSYLGIGILFWLQLIGSRPLRPRCGPLRRVAFIFATTGVGTVLGMILVFGSGVLYPAYGGTAHHVMTVLDDQQLAGAIVWMGILPPLIVAAVALLMRWLDDEESDALTAGLDRLLVQRQSAWPARPGSR